MADPITIDAVEYLPENGSTVELRERGPFTYVGIGPRASDGWTCLTLRSPGASRNFNVTVGYVYAITIRGTRHVLETPDERWKLRAEELRGLIESRREEWAATYFDRSSPSYFKAQSDYVSPYDPEYEMARQRRQDRPSQARSSAARRKVADQQEAGGCVGMILILLLPFVAVTLLLAR